MRKVAVTGGLACGKSSVCDFLKEWGAKTVSADVIVHDLLSTQTELGKQILDLLGEGVVISGQFDREQISERVFESPELLAKLEALIHPVVADKIDEMYKEAKDKHYSLFVAEVPLLFEAHLEGRFDKTVAVISHRDFGGKRFDDFAKRMQRQLTNEEKAERADFVLVNDGTLAKLKAATKKLYTQLLEE